MLYLVQSRHFVVLPGALRAYDHEEWILKIFCHRAYASYRMDDAEVGISTHEQFQFQSNPILEKDKSNTFLYPPFVRSTYTIPQYMHKVRKTLLGSFGGKYQGETT